MIRRWNRVLVGVAAAAWLVGVVGCGSDNSGSAGADTVTAGDSAAAVDTGNSTGGADVGNVDIGCVPSCESKECGPDGCGGTCAPGCAGGLVCAAGQCLCQAECTDKECGPDGCGGNCGQCDFGQVCHDSACVPGGDLSCAAYFVCIDACASDDAVCREGCTQAVVAEDAALVESVEACFDEHCADCDNLLCAQEGCGLDVCGQDYVSCFSGDEVCYEIYACVNGCVQQNRYGTAEYDGCRIDCLALGTADAQVAYIELESCIDEYCKDENGTGRNSSEFEGCEVSVRARECVNLSARCPQN